MLQVYDMNYSAITGNGIVHYFLWPAQGSPPLNAAAAVAFEPASVNTDKKLLPQVPILLSLCTLAFRHLYVI